jgi:protein tyrosine/serine phosphatase
MSSKFKNGLVRGIRRLLLLLLLAGLALGAFVLSVIAHHNFHIVSPGLVYRSAQMNAGALATVIPEYGIKSILNLRGAAEGKDWYAAEINTSRRLGVQHYDYALSAGRELKDDEMDQILATIRSAPKPILIHCKAGADRSGLVGALYLYSVEGQPAQSAQSQLAVFYGHVPHLLWSDTIAMDNSFWRYVSNHLQSPRTSAVNGSTTPDGLSSLSGPALAH